MRWQFSLRAALVVMSVIAVAIVLYQFWFPPPAATIPVSGALWRQRSFYAFGKAYDVDIRAEMLNGSPIWDRRRNPHPPLSPNTALTRADQLRMCWIEKGQLPDHVKSGSWEVQSVELVPGDNKHWYWLVSFMFVMDQSGPPNEFLVPVLMDGRVIEPKLRPEEPETTP